MQSQSIATNSSRSYFSSPANFRPQLRRCFTAMCFAGKPPLLALFGVLRGISPCLALRRLSACTACRRHPWYYISDPLEISTNSRTFRGKCPGPLGRRTKSIREWPGLLAGRRRLRRLPVTRVHSSSSSSTLYCLSSAARGASAATCENDDLTRGAVPFQNRSLTRLFYTTTFSIWRWNYAFTALARKIVSLGW